MSLKGVSFQQFRDLLYSLPRCRNEREPSSFLLPSSTRRPENSHKFQCAHLLTRLCLCTHTLHLPPWLFNIHNKASPSIRAPDPVTNQRTLFQNVPLSCLPSPFLPDHPHQHTHIWSSFILKTKTTRLTL